MRSSLVLSIERKKQMFSQRFSSMSVLFTVALLFSLAAALPRAAFAQINVGDYNAGGAATRTSFSDGDTDLTPFLVPG